LLDKPTQSTAENVKTCGAKAAEIDSHMQMLKPLLLAQDMTALEVFAKSREVLASLLVEKFDRLENAVQGLDFENALKVCQEIEGWAKDGISNRV
jgi:hypothetical protein